MEKGVNNTKFKQLLVIPFAMCICFIGYGDNQSKLAIENLTSPTITTAASTLERTNSEATQINLAEIKTNHNIAFVNDTLTITKGGTYHLSGILEGAIKVTANENVDLILDNVQVISNKGAAISFLGKANYTISTTCETENYLVDSLSNFEGAVIKSNGNLSITGLGTLIVTGLNQDAIVADNINFSDTTIDISAQNHSVNCRNLIINNSDITISGAGKILF